MAVLKFSTETTRQGSRQEIADTTKAALQMSVGGEPINRNPNSANPNAEPAFRFNGSAPYKPVLRPHHREKHCLAGNDTCMGWATASGYCRPHTLQMEESE